MKQLLFTLLIACCAQGLQAQKVINDANVEVRPVSGFSKIDISSAFEVIIAQGNTESVAVSSSVKGDNEHITTVVEGGKLRIGYKNKDRKWYRNQQLRAYISVKNLEAIGSSGASKITFEGTLAATNLHIDLSGATDLKGAVAVNNMLKLDLSGASDVTLTGAAGAVEIDASGASDVKAYDLMAGVGTVSASGACNIRMSVEKELSASLSGASNLQYKGNASVKQIRTSGASNVSKKS